MHTYTGVPASTGIVVGPVEQIDHGTTGLHRIVCDPFRERALYDVAVVLAKDELRRLSQRAKGPDADILLFQIALLEDESFTNEIGDYIAAGAGGAAAVERAEHILKASGATITHAAGDRAFYRPSTDSITLPERGQFPSSDRYYATALHELGHWTGHASRLDRDLAHPFGSEGYAKEELRAEIAAIERELPTLDKMLADWKPEAVQ